MMLAFLVSVTSFVAPLGRCLSPAVSTRTVSPVAREDVDAPLVAAVAALAVASVLWPSVPDVSSLGQLHYSSWTSAALAVPATACILLPFFGAFEVQEGSQALRLGLAAIWAPKKWQHAGLPAWPGAALAAATREADKADKALMAKARAAMALTAELAEERELRCAPHIELHRASHSACVVSALQPSWSSGSRLAPQQN